MSTSSPVFVRTPGGLAAATAELRAIPPDQPLGVDTEFHSERRYRPELMLVQLAVPDGRAWLFDPTCLDLAPLGAVLGNRAWVAHGAQFDVSLLYRATGALPRRLWDTQILAGFIGLGFPSRLALVVEAVLGHKPDKSSGLSDWSVRPLQPRQLAYAAADARLVLEMWGPLRQQVEAAGFTAAAAGACADLVAEARAPVAPERWRSWEIAPSFEEAERRVLRALFGWREVQAERRNKPPHYILHDGVALDLARRQPTTQGRLTENRKLPEGLVRRHSTELLAVIRAALAEDQPPPPPVRADDVLRARLLGVWAQARAQEIQVAAALLLPAPACLLAAQDGPSALSQWRQGIVRPHLDRFLSGQSGIFLSGKKAILS